MTRKSKRKIRPETMKKWSKFEINRSVVKLGSYNYRVWQIIDRPNNDMRIIAEAPPNIRRFIEAIVYKKLMR